jgi:hypothetical protein
MDGSMKKTTTLAIVQRISSLGHELKGLGEQQRQTTAAMKQARQEMTRLILGLEV